jgi:predicted enzyme related to lactoylglutathione lyase
MPKLTASAPILLVEDIVAAANYYRDRVGFSYERFWGEPPCFCILERDGMHLMLSRANDQADVRPHWKAVDKMWNVYFWVDDAAALYAELQQRGATIDYSLYDAPHGCREFGIQDLDGYDIAFGQILNK